MKQVTLCALALLALAFVVAGCRNTPSRGDRGGADSTLLADTAADSTVYGVCGEGTAMHTLELITDAGDTLRYVLGEDEDGRQDVQAGRYRGPSRRRRPHGAPRHQPHHAAGQVDQPGQEL